MQPSSLLATGLETVLNYYLRLDPEVMPAIAALDGKVIATEFVIVPPTSAEETDDGLAITLYFQPGSQGVRVTDKHWGTPDVSIRGTPLALARQFRAQPGTLDPAIEIRGDAQLGRSFQAALAAIDIDWEEYLSHVMGDVAAHQVGNTLREIGQWGRQVLNTLLQDAGEYFQHESYALPPHGAVSEFLDGVDKLRDDVDRLEARIHRLQQGADHDAG